MRDEFGRVVPGSQPPPISRERIPSRRASDPTIPSAPAALDAPLDAGRGRRSGPNSRASKRDRTRSASPPSSHRRDRRDRDRGTRNGPSRRRHSTAGTEDNTPTPAPEREDAHRAWECVRVGQNGEPEEWTRYVRHPLACARVQGRSNPGGEAWSEHASRYCTDLARGFFNAHLDDEWFRLLYSPAYRRAAVLQGRERGRQEAAALASECARDRVAFADGCRLGTGKTVRGRRSNGTSPAGHLLAGHLCALAVREVPEWATDGHITAALAEHAGGK
eukprot:CAMPEP_0194308438 /NCGR_PEP_ID=MMETSP0171-20130528/5413_1 /TAXON_ID=218684 /ORGANISM="Corethron pennatum, Strain L29A3" /LENGTH=275 /DNA_ID=CAMNT_0039061085 /DNA_START=175 /DNA_END=999 /DNA_ORIENTATION=+